MSVAVEGLTEASLALALLPEAFRAVAAENIAAGSAMIESEAAARAPVGDFVRGRYGKDRQPGQLRASIHRAVRADGLQATVAVGDEKARWVEFATVDTPAQPFLYPAFKVGARYVRKQMRLWAEEAGRRVRFKTKRRAPKVVK